MLIILSQYYSSSPTPDYDQIADVLRDKGHEVWVATPNADDELVIKSRKNIVAILKKTIALPERCYRIPELRQITRLTQNLVFALRLRRFIHQSRPDIIQVNPASLAFFWIIPLWSRSGTRYVLDWRQISERQHDGPLANIRREIALQRRRLPSRHIYDQACFLHPAGAKQVLGKEWQRWATVVPLAVRSSFLDDYCDISAGWKNDGVIRFVYLGTLSNVRRLERIILAADEVRLAAGNGNKFAISLIGPEKSNGSYQRLIDQLELNDIVKILPPIPYQEVPEQLAQHDVALAIVPEYPLDWQYHPTLKVLEYRALGMPIIATDLEPNREVVIDEVNGLLVSNSPQAIASAIQRFINEDGFLKKCVAHAQGTREGLLWQDISVQYEQLYLRLIQHEDDDLNQ